MSTNMITPDGITCEVDETESHDYRIVHFVIESVSRAGVDLPSMDAWIIDEGDDAHTRPLFGALYPMERGWPAYLLSFEKGSPEGRSLQDLIAEALDEYAAEHCRWALT